MKLLKKTDNTRWFGKVLETGSNDNAILTLGNNYFQIFEITSKGEISYEMKFNLNLLKSEKIKEEGVGEYNGFCTFGPDKQGVAIITEKCYLLVYYFSLRKRRKVGNHVVKIPRYDNQQCGRTIHRCSKSKYFFIGIYKQSSEKQEKMYIYELNGISDFQLKKTVNYNNLEEIGGFEHKWLHNWVMSYKGDDKIYCTGVDWGREKSNVVLCCYDLVKCTWEVLDKLELDGSQVYKIIKFGDWRYKICSSMIKVFEVVVDWDSSEGE